MGTMTIDGRKVKFTDEKNVLSVIRKAGINIPTLCYYSEVSTFGACRLCTVEDDRGRTFASCSEEPRDGMVIYTNSLKVKKYRKMIVELLLAAHERDCTTCIKSGECVLQNLAYRVGVEGVRFQNTREHIEKDESSYSIFRNPNKCILCGDCVRACEEVQGLGILGFTFRGTDARVMPAFDKKLAQTKCVGCGQCRVFCPTGAIYINTNRDQVWELLSDPDVRVIGQVAPAVRVAVGKAFGMKAGESVMGRIVNFLHRIGFDEVYDTTFGADLTVMEESKEFVNRVEAGVKLPLMTSCCPAWVKYVCDNYPEYRKNLSTCRSPQGMLSALTKEWFRNPKNAKGKRTVMVSIMPCTAKKMEIHRPNSFTKGEQDTDYVLTTSELIRMIKTSGIDFPSLDMEACDVPFGFGTGGGVIFGVTGGVTEAVLRRLVPEHDKASLLAIAESGVRGNQGIKEFSVPYGEKQLNICVASGLANAKKVLERVKSGEANYHLIEIMACPGGCVMGGGQPVGFTKDTQQLRAEGLYRADSVAIIKKSDENPMLHSIYAGFLKGKEHELLHNSSY